MTNYDSLTGFMTEEQGQLNRDLCLWPRKLGSVSTLTKQVRPYLAF